MIITGISIAIILCGVITLASYLHLLFVQSLRLRTRENPESLKYFETEIEPRLGFEVHDGLARYALVRQLSLVLLALDLMVLAIGQRDFSVAVVEVLFLVIASMMLFAHIVPFVLFRRTKGHWLAPLTLVAKIIGWVVEPLAAMTRFFSHVAELSAGDTQVNGLASPSEDIEALLDAGEEEGLIGQEDRKLIQSVVEFGDKTVREVVTPRPRMVALEENQTVEELWQILEEKGHSRFPVYEGHIDHIKGLVHARDTLDIEESQAQKKQVKELMRPVALVPETKLIHELLREMQESNAQMSIVIDEYGHTAGLVTMEDLMEEIVGEIRDESDTVADVVEQSDHSFIVDGNLDLDRLEELVGFRPDEEFESTTIGGLVCEQLGQVPPPGAKMTLDGIQIEVLAGDQKHVSSVRVRRLPDDTGGASGGNVSPESANSATDQQ